MTWWRVVAVVVIYVLLLVLSAVGWYGMYSHHGWLLVICWAGAGVCFGAAMWVLRDRSV